MEYDSPSDLADYLLREHMNTDRGPLVGSPYFETPAQPDTDPDLEAGFDIAANEMMEHAKNQDSKSYAASLRNFIRMCKDYE